MSVASPSPTLPEPEASLLTNPPQIVETEEHPHISASPSPTPEPKALPRINPPPQIIEIERPEEFEAAQRPPIKKSGEEVAPTSGGKSSATVRYFLMSNISVILKGNHTIIPARKDLFKMAMKPFPDIVNPTLTFGDRASDIPIEIHALQDHRIWTVEELQRFLVEGKSPKPHDSKRWDELLVTYRPPAFETFSVRRSMVRFFVNTAILCYMAPGSQGSKDTPSQVQASELLVLALSVSTGSQAMLDLAKSMSAHTPGGTYIMHQNQAVGMDKNALYQTGVQTGVNALVGGVLNGIFS